MNNDPKNYNPATDENQGVMTTVIQAEEANDGVPQVERMSPVMEQGPEPVKEELNEDGTDATNSDMLAEEDVEAGEANEKETNDE